MLQGILFAIVVILLLVVLVPVGVALYQKARNSGVRSSAGGAAPKAPRPAPPPLVLPPTAPVPVRSGAAAAPKRDDATRMVPLESAIAEAPAGTEMMRWNGMLHCVAGTLEGQRFIIDDEGFYIGRDPAFARIVVADSRISKRHVRILPRDGKVWAIDEGSTNGTFIKDQRITEVALKRGDKLVLGDEAATFVYEV